MLDVTSQVPNPLAPGVDIQIHVSWGTRLDMTGPGFGSWPLTFLVKGIELVEHDFKSGVNIHGRNGLSFCGERK